MYTEKMYEAIRLSLYVAHEVNAELTLKAFNNDIERYSGHELHGDICDDLFDCWICIFNKILTN